MVEKNFVNASATPARQMEPHHHSGFGPSLVRTRSADRSRLAKAAAAGGSMKDVCSMDLAKKRAFTP
jgi:hypothetical protein